MLGALTVAGLLALASAAHCAGMCGVFALQTAGRPLATFTYLLGKAATYVFLGALAGAAGERLGGVSREAVHALGWLAGGAMIGVAVRMLWGGVALGRSRVVPGLAGFLRGLVPTGRRPFLLGVVNGLLPCGVTALALMQALAMGSALGGAAVMAAFGVGTMPVLATLAWCGAGLQRRLSPAGATRLAAGLLLAGGVLFLVRVQTTECLACSS